MNVEGRGNLITKTLCGTIAPPAAFGCEFSKRSEHRFQIANHFRLRRNQRFQCWCIGERNHWDGIRPRVWLQFDRIEPYGDDHRLILECLEREPERLRGTSLFYPRDPAAPRKLVDLVAREPRIIATRFHAHRNKEMYLDSFDDRGVRALWEKAVELGLIVELHIGPERGGEIAAVLRDLPETIALIDHLAEPHMGSAVEFAEILDLAEYGNVFMKLSGLNHFADDAPRYASARSFTRRVVAEFGPQRMVWGSGSPEIVDVHLEGYGDAERALVKGGNLVQLIGF